MAGSEGAGSVEPPRRHEIAAARAALGDLVDTTPVRRLWSPRLERALGPDTEVFVKLESFQRAGSFKPRAALLNALENRAAAKRSGLTAVSAGNHAMAVGYAAQALGTTAKVVMPSNADPFRIAACREFGAEVVLVEDVHRAFDEVRRIEREEGRVFIHPFEGRTTAIGTATVGWEMTQQIDPPLDLVIVPIGGGGLAAGVAAAVKAAWPRAEVAGVEPTGADTMNRSFAAGRPVGIERVETIADSLGAPHAEPYSFAVCRALLDDLVRVDDEALIGAVGVLFEDAKLAVEPAGAASTAALLGPLARRARGRRVGLIVCGANVSRARFAQWLDR